MKFNEVKTLEHLLKEYGASGGGSTVGGGGHGNNAKKGKSIADTDASKTTTTSQGNNTNNNDQPTITKMKANTVKVGAVVVDKDGKRQNAYSTVGNGSKPTALVMLVRPPIQSNMSKRWSQFSFSAC